MLQQARKRADVEWAHGDLDSASWDAEFEFAVMTGHAFQALTDDKEIARSLAAACRALKPGGRFGFETRNPAAREWERWPAIYSADLPDKNGAQVRVETEVTAPLADGLVSFQHTFNSPAWPTPKVSRSTLRFLGVPTLTRFLADAGFEIDNQYGDWDRSPVTPASPEIITIARRPAG